MWSSPPPPRRRTESEPIHLGAQEDTGGENTAIWSHDGRSDTLEQALPLPMLRHLPACVPPHLHCSLSLSLSLSLCPALPGYLFPNTDSLRNHLNAHTDLGSSSHSSLHTPTHTHSLSLSLSLSLFCLSLSLSLFSVFLSLSLSQTVFNSKRVPVLGGYGA